MSTPIPLVAATTEFLRRYTPFDRMPDDVLADVVPKLKLGYFAKGREILTPRSGPVPSLFIVQRGHVGSHPDDSQSEPDHTLGPGEMFPVGALSAGGPTTKVFTAAEDSFCYQLSREDFIDLRRRSPEFERHCTQAITEILRQSLASLYGQYSQRAAEEQALVRTLGELVRGDPVSCPATETLDRALHRMSEANVRTVVVVDDAAVPVGMFTLVDLLRRVVLAGKPLSTPIAEVMTTPILTLAANATAYEAMHVMAERAIRQVVVVESGRLCGVVNERDLFALQRVTMRQVFDSLRRAEDIEGLKRAGEDIRRLTRNLLAQGIGADALTRTVASLNDAVTRRLIEIVAMRHDLSDCNWCWLALGSEGRGEQTFATDQDNALVFRADETVRELHRERLLAMAREVNNGLDELGYPLCTGKVMAGNPEYCLCEDEWRTRFLGWLRAPTPESLLSANVVFDFRPLFGNADLADELRQWLFGYTGSNPLFIRFMVDNALQTEVPLGIVRAFVVDDEPPHRGTLDLKLRGTRLFVDVARVFALAHGTVDTSTIARLRAAGERLGIEARATDAAIEAFHFLQLLRLRLQDAPGVPVSANRIDPYALNDVDQRMLKESLRQAKKLQQLLRHSLAT